MARLVSSSKHIAVIGAGPAGLMAAETLANFGYAVSLYDRMPSPARKFLLAGRGGLNLTHSEAFDIFVRRYRDKADWLRPKIAAFSPDDLRQWSAGLGESEFVGSSGRVFPKSFKASPLLRAWLKRLDGLGVRFHSRHHWQGFDDKNALHFEIAGQGRMVVKPDATILALGGASWPKLGADGSWISLLAEKGVVIHPLEASNTGVLIEWSSVMKDRFAGEPLKRIVLSCGGVEAKGEAMITESGLEGGAVYAIGHAIRDEVGARGYATLFVDLRRDIDEAELAERLAKPRGKASVSTWLQKTAGLAPAPIALLHEAKAKGTAPSFDDPVKLAKFIKQLPLVVRGFAGLERAISTRGGIDLGELDDRMMFTRLPGVFAAGEMLDWDAPTGGYLLQACFSTGVAAARGVDAWLKSIA
jgi:uncharacterized flavoprotein (TIGR03862 family)